MSNYSDIYKQIKQVKITSDSPGTIAVTEDNGRAKANVLQ